MSTATERPTLFILLGAAGDLAWRLVVPALFQLYRSGKLPRQFSILGLDRADLDNARLAKRLYEGCNRFGSEAVSDAEIWQGFIRVAQRMNWHITQRNSIRSN